MFNVKCSWDVFYNRLDVIVPLQVLRNCGAQQSEWLHCSRSAVHDGEWGESGGVLLSPEVHDHLDHHNPLWHGVALRQQTTFLDLTLPL